jgi:hypothetical protein
MLQYSTNFYEWIEFPSEDARIYQFYNDIPIQRDGFPGVFFHFFYIPYGCHSEIQTDRGEKNQSILSGSQK